MNTVPAELRKSTIAQILAKQDASSRWGFDEDLNQVRPEYLHYIPKYKATLWTLILLADIKAPRDLPQAQHSLGLLGDHFFSPKDGIFTLPSRSHFPIPCLNGNMIYLQNYFGASDTGMRDKVISFFSAYQRYDDGDFKTPRSYPYCGNISCYGRHTCYWGVTKLFKGISFIPASQRSTEAKRLLENCIHYVLQHQVCFSSHDPDILLHRDMTRLTFPKYKSDFLELLWLLARESVRDARITRALDLLRLRMKDGEYRQLETPPNTIVPIGKKKSPNLFITERAAEVLEYYGG